MLKTTCTSTTDFSITLKAMALSDTASAKKYSKWVTLESCCIYEALQWFPSFHKFDQKSILFSQRESLCAENKYSVNLKVLDKKQPQSNVKKPNKYSKKLFWRRKQWSKHNKSYYRNKENCLDTEYHVGRKGKDGKTCGELTTLKTMFWISCWNACFIYYQ